MSARLCTPEQTARDAMTGRLLTPNERALAVEDCAAAIATDRGDILARIDEAIEWSFDERKMIDKINALRAELRGAS